MEESIKPANSKTVPLLLGFIALLLLIIAILLFLIFTKQQSSSVTDIKPTQTELTTPSANTTQPPSNEWKTITQTVETYYSDIDKVITGSFPSDTVIKTTGLDASGVNYSNQSYSLSVLFVADSDVVHYDSYTPIPKHKIFGDVNRIKLNDNANISYYTNSVVTKTGGCMYLEELIESPCGVDSVSILILPDPSKGIQENDFITSIKCEASEENTVNICDKIVNNLTIN